MNPSKLLRRSVSFSPWTAWVWGITFVPIFAWMGLARFGEASFFGMWFELLGDIASDRGCFDAGFLCSVLLVLFWTLVFAVVAGLLSYGIAALCAIIQSLLSPTETKAGNG